MRRMTTVIDVDLSKYYFDNVRHRRQLLWFAVTRHPTAEWLAQQIIEAFPWETAPTYLVRDNDGAYGQIFRRRVRAMGIRDRPISLRSPWQNPYAERLIGTLRRDCLDHVVIFGARHLQRVLTGYSAPLLQSDTNAFVVGQGCTARSINPTTGSDRCCTDSVGTASLLFADMIFRRDNRKTRSCDSLHLVEATTRIDSDALFQAYAIADEVLSRKERSTIHSIYSDSLKSR